MGEVETKRVFRFIDEHFDDFVTDLTDYCAVRTVSARGEGFKEGGRATRERTSDMSKKRDMGWSFTGNLQRLPAY